MGVHAEEQTWQAHLRAKGYRLTHQRQCILEAVTELGHATPEEILTRVRSDGTSINISTVYRTLDVLEELGLVSHCHLGHGAPAYQAAIEHGHLHLVCGTCGSVDEAEPSVAADLVAQLAAAHGFAVDMSHFVIAGTCARCQK